MILTFSNVGDQAKPSSIGKPFMYRPGFEEAKRIKVGTSKDEWEIGRIVSVHPQNRTATVEIHKNREAWVKRVVMGQDAADVEKV
jgi:hypothetical protein